MSKLRNKNQHPTLIMAIIYEISRELNAPNLCNDSFEINSFRINRFKQHVVSENSL